MSMWDMVLAVASCALGRLLVEGDSEEATRILRETMLFIKGPDWDLGATRRIFTVTKGREDKC
jgi:hypothetical protein